MGRLIASEKALEVLLALTQRPEGMRLVDLADALHAGTSTVQKALQLLVSDGFVQKVEGDRTYRPTQHPAVRPLIDLVYRILPPERLAEVVCRANQAVEFAGEDRKGYLLIIRRFAHPSDEARLQDAFQTIGSAGVARPVTRIGHNEVPRLIEQDSRLDRRARRMKVIKGSLQRSFPASTRRRGGRPLGRLHAAIRHPSQGKLADLAKQHRLARIIVFGSAVRGDFRADSDVDVLVEPRRGATLGFDDVIEIRRRLEEAFERDVDLVNARYMRPSARDRAHSEGVVLYG